MLDKRLLKYDKILLSKADEAQRYCYPGLMKHIDFLSGKETGHWSFTQAKIGILFFHREIN